MSRRLGGLEPTGEADSTRAEPANKLFSWTWVSLVESNKVRPEINIKKELYIQVQPEECDITQLIAAAMRYM
mgnify:CR=1 FL=1